MLNRRIRQGYRVEREKTGCKGVLSSALDACRCKCAQLQAAHLRDFSHSAKLSCRNRDVQQACLE
jgi:hypothetical protein